MKERGDGEIEGQGDKGRGRGGRGGRGGRIFIIKYLGKINCVFVIASGTK